MDTRVLAFVSASIMMMVAVWYCPLIIKRRVTPPPATWIIGSVAMNLSAWSYYATGRHWMDNIVVYSAAVEILIVTTTLLVSLYRHEELLISFDRVQKVCLASMAGIMTYWALYRDAEVTFATTQLLMVIAYIPTMVRGVRTQKVFDSIGNWGLITLASLAGCAIPFLTGNGLAQIAVTRAVLTSGLTTAMFARIDRQNGWSNLKNEAITVAKFYRLF